MVGGNLTDRTERTYYYERRRAITAGILDSASATFLLLISVRWFNASGWAKGLVASGGSMGLLLAPWVVAGVGKARWATARAAAGLSVFGAACFVIMAVFPILPVFVLGSLLAMAAASSAVPLMTQIYQENYPEKRRGRLFSRTVMIRIAMAAIFSEVAGRALSGHLERYRLLLLVFGAAFIFSAWCLTHCPSQPLAAADSHNPFRTWNCVVEDRLFRYTLICWMLMGFANLMMFPLRVEYLANPKYGWALKISMIALFTGVIPNIARLCMSPFWGWSFDHLNFFALRIILNLGFGLGILTFFLSHDRVGLVLGSIVFGIANAGGDVAWGLWVTKFAPPHRVADYMAVHTFFTGLRGVVAPLIAFQVVQTLSIGTLGWISAGLILMASLMLLPEVKFGAAAPPAAPIVEEVSE